MAFFITLALWMALHYPSGAAPPVPKASRTTPKRKRGRPPKPRKVYTLLTEPLRKPRGGQRRYDKPGIVQWVDAHKAKVGGRMSDARALCEGIVEALKTIDPAKHRHVEKRRRWYVDDGCSPARALRQAVLDVEGEHFKTLTVTLSKARHGR